MLNISKSQKKNLVILLTAFSELKNDEYLLNQIGEGKTVSIFGCPFCANQSIAISKDISVIGKLSFGGLKYEPYAVTQEANRIKELFKTKGVATDEYLRSTF